MKWFKHLTGALNDNLIFEAIERFGGDGYLVFFGTLEIMADEFDVHNPGVSRISIKKLTQNFQLSRQKLVKILSFFDEKAKIKSIKNKSFFVSFEKDHVIIKCSRLAELCDEHTRKTLRKTPESVRSESGKSPSIEEEVEVETPIVPFTGDGLSSGESEELRPEKPTADGAGKSTQTQPDNPEQPPQDFLTLYSAYPGDKPKGPALKAWKRIGKGRPPVRVLLDAVERQKAWRAQKKPGEFVPRWPYLSTWLNQRRWEDEVDVVVQKPVRQFEPGRIYGEDELTDEEKKARGWSYDKAMRCWIPNVRDIPDPEKQWEERCRREGLIPGDPGTTKEAGGG